MQKELIKIAFKEKKLIGLKTNWIDFDESIIGFITKIDEALFTINEIDEFGYLIGNTVIDYNDVNVVEIDDLYQKRLNFIIKQNSKLNPNSRITIWGKGIKLISNFKFLINEKKITTVFYGEDEYVIGIILDYDKKYLKINNIGRDGISDGISCYNISTIIGLRYDGLDEQVIKLFYDNNKNNQFQE